MNYTDKLIGAWSLESWKMQYSDRSDVLYPYGEDAEGLLIYAGNGWMNASICHGSRTPLPEGVHPKRMPAEQPAGAYASFFQYAGPFRVEGDTVIHEVTLSLNPNLVGTQQVRRMEFAGNKLFLRGDEVSSSKTRTHLLQWTRA